VATTKDVRDCFLGQVVALPDGSLGFGDTDELGREFDAWLIKLKSDAWDEGYNERDRGGMTHWNPYIEGTE
jgi:hypothetical protein